MPDSKKAQLTPFEKAELNVGVLALRLWILSDFQELIKSAEVAEEEWIEAIERRDRHLENVLTDTLTKIDVEISNIAIALQTQGGESPLYN